MWAAAVCPRAGAVARRSAGRLRAGSGLVVVPWQGGLSAGARRPAVVVPWRPGADGGPCARAPIASAAVAAVAVRLPGRTAGRSGAVVGRFAGTVGPAARFGPGAGRVRARGRGCGIPVGVAAGVAVGAVCGGVEVLYGSLASRGDG
jgi:hypothetical protein